MLLQTGSDSDVEEADGTWEPRVLTGLQPTGALHAGNYWGAVRRCVELQDEGRPLTVCIADLHALTAGVAPGLPARVLDAAATLLAAGLDERSILYVQSAVPRHAELCWLLTCHATVARVSQLPQYRERASGAGAGLGVLAYPVLQAADVLLHRGTLVPAGRDQLRHVQLAAHLARAVNRTARRPLLPAPRALLPPPTAARLLSLRDPLRKMSKSDPDPRSRLLLTDSDDEICLKLRKAVTDCEPHVSFESERRPGVSNLVALHCLASGLEPEEAVEEAGGLTTAQYKERVAAAVVAALGPVRERARELRRDEDGLRAVLRAGARRARVVADRTYRDVAEAFGLQVS